MKVVLTILLISVSLIVSAQNKAAKETKDSTSTEHIAKNEIRLNLLNSVLSLPEINYEHILKNNTSFGLAVFIGVKDKFDFNYGIIPYYRIYFSKSEKTGVGFFIEANAGIVNLIKEQVSYTPQGQYPSFNKTKITSYGMGFATGGKFLTKNNFVGEIYLGGGHFLGDYGSENGYPRMGITIGKRF